MVENNKQFPVDETLNPMDDSYTAEEEVRFIAEIIGEINDADKLMKNLLNKVLRQQMAAPIDNSESSVLERMRNRVRYEFFQRIRTEVLKYQTAKTKSKR